MEGNSLERRRGRGRGGGSAHRDVVVVLCRGDEPAVEAAIGGHLLELRREGFIKGLHIFPSHITRDDCPITRDYPSLPSNITREVTHRRPDAERLLRIAEQVHL